MMKNPTSSSRYLFIVVASYWVVLSEVSVSFFVMQLFASVQLFVKKINSHKLLIIFVTLILLWSNYHGIAKAQMPDAQQYLRNSNQAKTSHVNNNNSIIKGRMLPKLW